LVVKAKTKGSMKNLKNTQTRNLLTSKIMKNKNQRLLTKPKNRITLVITSDHPIQGVQFTMPFVPCKS
jgi:hypothetical protein